MEEHFFSPLAPERPSSDEPEKTPSLLVSNEELTTRRDDCSPLVQRILDDADTAASTQLKEQGIKASLLAEAAVTALTISLPLSPLNIGALLAMRTEASWILRPPKRWLVVCCLVCAVPNAHSKTLLLIFVIACSLVLRQLFVDSFDCTHGNARNGLNFSAWSGGARSNRFARRGVRPVHCVQPQ